MNVIPLLKRLDGNLFIGQNLLEGGHFSELCGSLGSRLVVITDTTVKGLYGEALIKSLRQDGLQADLIAFPEGEASKTRQTKEYVEDQLVALGAGRDTCILALGGGVVTDLVGFVASTFCRGVSFISIPTSLMAMVDASIGGKTGVNIPGGKNLIGAFYPPQAVFIDLAVLRTLPEKELLNGMMEVIKHGLICKSKLFEHIEEHTQAILSGDSTVLAALVEASCEVKLDVVWRDEREGGLRRILNFGHTIGHAIETASKHTISHGEGVACGMIAESYIAMKLGSLSSEEYLRIRHLLHSFGMGTSLDASVDIDELLKIMSRDKKSLNSQARFVMLNGIGKTLDLDGEYCTPVDEALVREAIHAL